jgi:kynurenine formamidase
VGAGDHAPHLLGVDGYVADLPLERCIGTGVLLDARGERLIGMRPEYVAIPENSIVLVCTGHSAQFGTAEYFENHPLVDPSLAEHLIAKKIKMLGIDLPSADLPPFPVHRMLFRHGIPILENLTNLEALLGVNRFEVIALPLKINAEGSPLRVVARVK